jgi:hypothetical protein
VFRQDRSASVNSRFIGSGVWVGTGSEQRIWLISEDQQYVLICTNPLFYVLAPTCFGSSLPSSRSFLDPPELLEIQIECVVYHIMCGYVACVPNYRGFVETTAIRHYPFDLYFK